MSEPFDLPDYDAAHDEVMAVSLPPHSVEAEQSVLGGLLLENSAMTALRNILTEEDFYRQEHRATFFVPLPD